MTPSLATASADSCRFLGLPLCPGVRTERGSQSLFVPRVMGSRGLPPLIVMMQPTDFRKGNHSPHFLALNRPWIGAVHIERQMRSVLMVVAEILGEAPLEMLITQDDDVVRALPVN